MFGIGLPEMLLIMALALIVVGPDKLPDLARSLAKGLMELKKTAEGLKDQLSEEGNPLDDIKPDLEEAAKALKDNLLESPDRFENFSSESDKSTPKANASAAYDELMQQTSNRQNIEEVDLPENTASVDEGSRLDDKKTETSQTDSNK